MRQLLRHFGAVQHLHEIHLGACPVGLHPQRQAKQGLRDMAQHEDPGLAALRRINGLEHVFVLVGLAIRAVHVKHPVPTGPHVAALHGVGKARRPPPPCQPLGRMDGGEHLLRRGRDVACTDEGIAVALSHGCFLVVTWPGHHGGAREWRSDRCSRHSED
ncbi:hypothetical protein D3C72_1798480 [compost metagenome]